MLSVFSALTSVIARAITPHWLLAFLCSVFKERRDTHPRGELVPGPSLFRGGEVALARSRSMSPQEGQPAVRAKDHVRPPPLPCQGVPSRRPLGRPPRETFTSPDTHHRQRCSAARLIPTRGPTPG